MMKLTSEKVMAKSGKEKKHRRRGLNGKVQWHEHKSGLETNWEGVGHSHHSEAHRILSYLGYNNSCRKKSPCILIASSMLRHDLFD